MYNPVCVVDDYNTPFEFLGTVNISRMYNLYFVQTLEIIGLLNAIEMTSTGLVRRQLHSGMSTLANIFSRQTM